MSDHDEFNVLVTAVGEYTLSALGRDNLRGLRVTLDHHEMSCHVTIALENNSDANQKHAIQQMFDVEQIYFDELVMSFSLVESLDDVEAPRESVPQYSFA